MLYHLSVPVSSPYLMFCALFGQTVGTQASEEPKPVGAYRPPAYRAPGRRVPGVKSKTPELDSEIAFPSLSAAMATSKRLVVVYSYMAIMRLENCVNCLCFH